MEGGVDHRPPSPAIPYRQGPDPSWATRALGPGLVRPPPRRTINVQSGGNLGSRGILPRTLIKVLSARVGRGEREARSRSGRRTETGVFRPLSPRSHMVGSTPPPSPPLFSSLGFRIGQLFLCLHDRWMDLGATGFRLRGALWTFSRWVGAGLSVLGPIPWRLPPRPCPVLPFWQSPGIWEHRAEFEYRFYDSAGATLLPTYKMRLCEIAF